MLRNFINTVRRFKAFTLLNLIGLTISFLVFMVVVMQVRVELTHDTSYPDSEQIYVIQQQSQWEKGTWTSMFPRPVYDAVPSFAPQAEQYAIRSFSSVVFGGERYKFESGTIPAFNQTSSKISRSFVDMFDMQIVDGAIGSDEEPWLMIPESLAKRCFPDGSAVGQMLSVVGENSVRAVSAVYRDFPSTSSFPNEIYSNIGRDDMGLWGDSNYRIYLKLPSKALLPNVKSAVERFTAENQQTMQVRFLPIADQYFLSDSASMDSDVSPGSSRDSLMVFLFVAILIIFVAGINYLNFTTALIPTRIKDINTRKIYGANNFSIRMQLVSESMLMCLTAFIIATCVLMCFETLDLVSFISTRTVISEQIVFTATLTGLLSLAVGLLVGLYPAIYATSIKAAYVIKGAFAMSGKGRALRNILLGVQYVFSIALITMAVVMNLQYGVLNQRDMGFDRENVLTIDLSNKLAVSRASFISELRSRPDIKDFTYTIARFFSEDNAEWKRSYKDSMINFTAMNVSSSFPKFFGIEMVEGDGFQPSDDQKEQHATLVFNQAAQRRYGIKAGDEVQGMRVAGIMRDFNYTPLRNSIAPMALSNIGNFIEQYPDFVDEMYLYLRCQSSDYSSLIDFIRAKGLAIDPDWEADIAFMDSRINELYKNEARTIFQINLSSAIAIIISLLGVFGLIHFDMQRRRKEVALRKINGATIVHVLAIFNRKFVCIVCICFVIAAPLAWWAATVWLSDFAYRTPVYWWIFAIALFVVLLITTLTVTIQSWKAASENPVNSLKSE